MPGTQETQNTERTFDESGETVDAAAAEETEIAEEEIETEGDEPAEEVAKGKIRIGDQEFATVAEAHAYATQQVQQGDENAAYRRLVNELVTSKPPGETVTPAIPAIDEEKLWANPTEFLQNFAKDIKAQTAQEIGQSIHQQRVQQANDDAIFGEFTNRHPDLADFRSEIEQYTAQNRAVISNLATTKGRPAAYDYVALNLRERFNKYAEATKPRRVLKNGAGNAAPAGKGPSVTPAGKKNKPLSLAEQIRTIKKVKR